MSVTRMFDDVSLDLIPADAPAVAGYVNGRWPTYPQVVKRWPHARHLSIAVTSLADAEMLDVEAGDASPTDAPRWVKRQQARGIARPGVYCSVSQAVTVLRVLASAGIKREDILLWTAHYTGRAHLCNPQCGFGDLHADATQWTDRALGRSLDESLLSPTFFGPPPKPLRWYATWRLTNAARIGTGKVRALQKALNRRGDDLDEDDELGPITYRDATELAYSLGVSNRQLKRGITLSMRRLIERRRQQTRAEKRRAGAR